jgi:hypothetical protein
MPIPSLRPAVFLLFIINGLDSQRRQGLLTISQFAIH